MSMNGSRMNSIIRFENVTLRYDAADVLQHINLNIQEGEHTVILGPNGSGKSTLIKLISCELYPSIASMPHVREIMGQERWEVAQLRRHLGIVTNDLHNRFTFEGGHLSALEAVISGFFGTLGVFDHQQILPEYNDAAKAAMERVGIGDLADKKLGEMSTGQLRRSLVARALVHPVKAILLDEPTVGLDIKAQLEFIEMMRSLANSGTTVILVTHHIEEVFEEIKTAVLIKEGTIYASGQKDEMLNSANLSEIFNTPLHVQKQDNRYSIHPVT